VSPERAGELLDASPDEIETLYSAIEDGGGQLNDKGEFIGLALTLEPTRHRITMNNNDMYAWCSLDTILIPGLLETEGEVESTDPLTGEPIRLTVTADRVVEVDPPGAVTSIFVPGLSPKETAGDLPVGADSEVCQSMLFYASRENAERALANYPNIAIFTIEEAFNLAYETWTTPTRVLRAQHTSG
jgi:alkylmercury lyase